ncbi:MAG: hypothetical protein SFX72_05465 [Isosphaeraceae bacterium]|nr:hypothetical protein [Isosphaeraceae bacterium]
MNETSPPSAVEEWVDPGTMDASIWVKKKPGPIERWIKRIVFTGLLMILPGIHLVNRWGLPDPGLPAQLASWRTRELSDERNAAVLYRIAAEAIPARKINLADLTDWSRIEPEERAWLATSMRALLVWREGTRRPECDSFAARPETRRLTEPEASAFSRLVLLEGLRLENLGRNDDALDWYLSLLRFSRHQANNTLFHERFRSLAILQSVAPRLAAWSDHPNQSVQGLQRALRGVLEARELLAPPSGSILAEIDRLERALLDPARLDRELALDAFNRPGQDLSVWAERLGYASRLFQAEPDRSRRVIRSIMANWLDAVESRRILDRSERLDFSNIMLFRDDRGTPVREFESLAAVLATTRYAQFAMPHINGFVTTLSEDERHFENLVRHLGEAVFRRLNGRNPTSPEEVDASELSSPP